MRIWMHKETGELAVARQIWLEADFPMPDTEYSVQLRVAKPEYVFENGHGVVLVLPPKIQDSFEDLGEL